MQGMLVKTRFLYLQPTTHLQTVQSDAEAEERTAVLRRELGGEGYAAGPTQERIRGEKATQQVPPRRTG